MGIYILKEEAVVVRSRPMPILVDSLFGVVIKIPRDILVEILVVDFNFSGG